LVGRFVVSGAEQKLGGTLENDLRVSR
jgi:hypothetical protein